MKYFSMFSGIGGFELGFPPEWECVGYSEIDKYAVQVYQQHFPSHINYGDATVIDPETLPDFDLLCGGFPCQAFSVAGKRQGFHDTRGTLFFDIARILKHKRPRYLLLENVKGLLSHDNGKTFQTILRVLTNLGYEYQWQVLNSKDFGVPQNRERVFIVGHLGGEPRPQVFPLTGDGGKTIVQINNPTHSNDRVFSDEGISPTLNTMQGGNRQPKILAIDTKQQGKPRFTENSPTLQANQYKEPVKVLKGNIIRRITPTECERLQGFPDGWTAILSDTQRYKTLGNAVTVNVIRAISQKLL